MDEQTFLTSVNQTADCWLWTKATTAAGYGVFSRQSKTYYAHQHAWKLWKSPDLPAIVRHTCRNRHCVNPDHLEAGTHLENQRDRHRDGTDNKGERHGNHKLTTEQVIEMRRFRREGASLEELMNRYGGVSHSTILFALTGRDWSHVPDPLTKEEMKATRKHRAGKLTDEQTSEIQRRAADGVKKTRLAKDFGVTVPTISRALKNLTPTW